MAPYESAHTLNTTAKPASNFLILLLLKKNDISLSIVLTLSHTTQFCSSLILQFAQPPYSAEFPRYCPLLV
jgi:hypothetical protein